MDQRLKEAAKLGFARAVVPAAHEPERQAPSIALQPLSQLSELVALFGPLPAGD
jgi:predicted ATP-dependent serine protease